MAPMRVETLYNQQIKPLPPADRLQLLALTAHDLAYVSPMWTNSAPLRSIWLTQTTRVERCSARLMR